MKNDASVLLDWLGELPYSEGKIDATELKYSTDNESFLIHASLLLHTATHQYRIYGGVRLPEGRGSYLGCIALSRVWRPGEDWHRGNDLPDGPLNKETFNKIIQAIVGYELLTPVDRSQRGGQPDEGCTAATEEVKS